MVSKDLIYLFVFFMILFGLVMTADVIRKRLGWPPESTRKFVHIFVGIVVVYTPFVLSSMWPMIILGSLFAVLDLIAVNKTWFTGMHGTKRHSYGTVFYPVSFVILVYFFWNRDQLVLITAMMIMAVADALAAIVGERLGKTTLMDIGLEKKSWAGTFTMMLSSAVITYLCIHFIGYLSPAVVLPMQMIWISLMVGTVAAACEMISRNGSDNLTVPLGSAFVLEYLLYNSQSDMMLFALGMVLALIVALLSFRFKFLDAGGSVGTFLLGTLVFGIGGWSFTLPILTFFVLSSLISKIGKRRKQKLLQVFEKSGQRDIWQVLANGGVPGLLVIVWSFYPHDLVYLFYVGALAAVMADTWSTEIGVLSKQEPVSVITFKKVDMGTSGGITLLGTLGGLLGASILVFTGWLSGPHSSPAIIGSKEIIVLVAAGLLAGLIDSILGATVQAKFRCAECKKITEKKVHCNDITTQHDSGYRWINNDVVNLFCAISSSGFILLFWLLLY